MASTRLPYLNQYFITQLSVVGGINDSQTTGIVLQSVSGLDITKPGVALINYSNPLSTSICEWVTYTSINGSNELQGVVRGAEGFSARAHDNTVSVAFPISESHINILNAMFDSTGLDLAEIATPASPDSGRRKIYFKSDGKLYKLNSLGVEVEVGAATGVTTRFVNANTGDFNAGASGTPVLASASAGNAYGWLMDAGATEDIWAVMTLPADYAGGTVTPKLIWEMESATSGNVVWQVQVAEIRDNTAIGTIANLLNHQQTVAVPGVADTVEVTSFNTFTPTAGDLIRVRILRLGGDGSDTATGDAVIFGIKFEYTSTI